MNIIGITGRKRSGKDSLANIINETSNNEYIKISFADPMRNIMYDICNPSRKLGMLVPDWDDFNYELEKEFDALVLDTTQSFFKPSLVKALSYKANTPEEVRDNGVKFMKWVKQFENRLFSPREFLQKLGTEFGRKQLGPDVWVETLLSSLDKDKNYIIPDVRFDNEASAIKKYGGEIIRTLRPGTEGCEDTHESESGIDESYVDTTIVAENLTELKDNYLNHYHG